jgi:hypothetical protein
MLELVIIVLIIVLIVWLVTGITRTRKSPLDDIAKLAAIEATAPQDSASRKLLAEELARPKKRQGLAIVLGVFFLIIYISAHTSGTPTQQASAPVDHHSAVSLPEPDHAPLICGIAGDCGGNSDAVKLTAPPAVPQKHLYTVIKSRPACLLVDDYVQLVNMAISSSPTVVRSAVGFANEHCQQRLEIGQKVWIEDEAERMIDVEAERTINGSRTIKLACVSRNTYMINTPPDYKPTCYWTALSVLD